MSSNQVATANKAMKQNWSTVNKQMPHSGAGHKGKGGPSPSPGRGGRR
jgi:hypothetical protein